MSLRNHLLIEHQRITGVPKKIGCLTSPHYIDVRERILINNQKLTKNHFAYYIRELNNRLWALSCQPNLQTLALPRYPGPSDVAGHLYFIKEQVDVAILETGIGGENNSTNVFPQPAIAGITTIGLDHVDVLGDTVEEIAWHKAGIFKANCHRSEAF